MSEPEVTAAEIARIAGVGRAAVSNWRRRHADFPQPVGGSPSSPTFNLAEIKSWLRAQGKQSAGDAVDQLAREIGARHGDDAFALLTAAAQFLRRPTEPSTLDEGLRDTLRAASGQTAGPELLDDLVERIFPQSGRGQHFTSIGLARLVIDLVEPGGATVLDPACGAGTLLAAAARAGATQLFGQEINSELARFAAERVALSSESATVGAGDALRRDAFPDLQADIVVCEPPFGTRNWGFEELAYDPRWKYGQPARNDSELAWVQHCLAHVRPGGCAAVVLPAGVNWRASGRRVRGELVRHGVLRAVVALPPAGSSQAPLTLWLLRPPADEAPDRILLVDASGQGKAAHDLVLSAWRSFAAGNEVDGSSVVLPTIDLLDDAIDLNPARHVDPGGMIDAAGLVKDGKRLQAAVRELIALVPPVRPLDKPHRWPGRSVGDLAKAGAIVLLRGNATSQETGPVAVLTAHDVMGDRAPSGRTEADEEQVIVSAGDVVVPLITVRPAARVIREPGAALGRNLQLLRPNPDVVDPEFLAGFLRSGSALRVSSSLGGAYRLDVRRVEVPVLSLVEQRRLGLAFARIAAAESALRQVSTLGSEYFLAVTNGLAAGQLTVDTRGGKRG